LEFEHSRKCPLTHVRCVKDVRIERSTGFVTNARIKAKGLYVPSFDRRREGSGVDFDVYDACSLRMMERTGSSSK
jgi:hypothetical protein